MILATSSAQAVWYLIRGSGLVDQVLLTASVALGVAEVVRYARPGWPRFVWAALHRNVSILAVIVLALHVVLSTVDSFVSIPIADAFVPFLGTYDPFWLGLGAIALDLLLAVAITSAVRGRIGRRTWRAVHWASYACWPIAIAHGLGMGTDAGSLGAQILTGVCVGAVAAAVVWRVVASRRGLARPGRPVVVEVS